MPMWVVKVISCVLEFFSQHFLYSLFVPGVYSTWIPRLMAFTLMIPLPAPAVDLGSTWTPGAAPSWMSTSFWETGCISYEQKGMIFFWSLSLLVSLSSGCVWVHFWANWIGIGIGIVDSDAGRLFESLYESHDLFFLHACYLVVSERLNTKNQTKSKQQRKLLAPPSAIDSPSTVETQHHKRKRYGWISCW